MIYRNAVEDVVSCRYMPLPNVVQAPEENPETLLKLSPSYLYKFTTPNREKVKSCYNSALVTFVFGLWIACDEKEDLYQFIKSFCGDQSSLLTPYKNI